MECLKHIDNKLMEGNIWKNAVKKKGKDILIIKNNDDDTNS